MRRLLLVVPVILASLPRVEARRDFGLQRDPILKRLIHVAGNTLQSQYQPPARAGFSSFMAGSTGMCRQDDRRKMKRAMMEGHAPM